MSIIEAIVEAIQLAILIVGYAVDESKKRGQAVTDAKTKRAQFEDMVTRALAERRASTAVEKPEVDAVDESADAAAKKKLPVDKLGTGSDNTAQTPRSDAQK